MIKLTNKQKRRFRIKSKLSGSAARPRLAVYKSSKHIYAQIIDDVSGKTVVGVHSRSVKTKSTKSELATSVGKQIAEKAKKAGIEKVVFDRGGNKYHGRVKALADSARESGLVF